MPAVSAAGNDRPPECWTAITVCEDVELGNVEAGDGESAGTEFGGAAFGDVDGAKFGDVECDVGAVTVNCWLASTAELAAAVAGL
jgi:hypothetical protein